MAINVSGAEFKRFYADPAYWPEDNYHEDVCFAVNSTEVDGIDVDTLADTDIVTIEGGFLMGPAWEDGEGPSLEDYFKQWRKAQTTLVLTVECDKSIVDAVKTAIYQAGGRLI